MKKTEVLVKNDPETVSISALLTFGLVALNTVVKKLEKVKPEDLTAIDIYKINLMCITLSGQLEGYRMLLERLKRINPLMMGVKKN